VVRFSMTSQERGSLLGFLGSGRGAR
jgi:hypothetical protein